MCTGDVMEQREPNKLIWIDRRKNIVKLAQGEFVSLSRLEQEYIGVSGLIFQMFLYGNGLRSYLLAVIVPSPGALLIYTVLEALMLLRAATPHEMHSCYCRSGLVCKHLPAQDSPSTCL